MIADATTIDRSIFDQTFDVCVIGAGPAGITIARPWPPRRQRRADGGRRPRAHRREPGRLRGDQPRPRLLRPRHRAAALLRRHLQPLGRLAPRARRLRLPPEALRRSRGWPISRLDLDPYRADADANPRPPLRHRGARPAVRARRPTTSAASSSAGARRPASARSTAPRSRPPTASASSSTPTSSTCASTTRSSTVDRRASSAPTTPPTPASRSRPAPTPLHRRHRERAAAAQLHRARSPRASATAPTWSAAASATTRTSCSPTSCFEAW